MNNDVFADIGLRALNSRQGNLEEVKPAELPPIFLPSEKSDSGAAFELAQKIDSAEELAAELARQRQHYAPFLEDLAPPFPPMRISKRIEEFQWRLETAGDRKNFGGLLAGAGEWTEVKMPHYGGPIGRAVAYYRTSFSITREMLEKGSVFVCFRAVDYIAHVFVKARFLGSHEGFFAPFEFECGDVVNEGENIRSDRWKFFEGEVMPFEFWVCNDTHHAPEDLLLRWQVEQKGRVVFAQKVPARIESTRATFQGFFAPQAPAVAQRTQFTLRLALGEIDTSIEYEVFPKLPLSRPSPCTRVIRDYAEYLRSRREFDSMVCDGGRVVFLELPPGEYEIGGSVVKVSECMMRPREFVSRATGHPLVEGFGPEDFKCWYDPEAGWFRPLLGTVFEAEGWIPILTSGNGVSGGGGTWKAKLASAELPAGNGSYIVCQIGLEAWAKHNPIAGIFLHRLMEGGSAPAASNHVA